MLGRFNISTLGYYAILQVLSLRSDLSKPVKPETEDHDDMPNLPEQELKLRDAAIDFETRYLGHCNTTTDIKVYIVQ